MSNNNIRERSCSLSTTQISTPPTTFSPTTFSPTTFSPTTFSKIRLSAPDSILSPTMSVKWNDKVEEAVKTIGESSQSYKHLHNIVAMVNASYYYYLMLFAMMVGPLCGTLSAMETVMTDTMVRNKISLVVAVLGYISGVTVAVIKFGKFDEVSSANKQAAARYTSLESNARRQLTLYRDDRMNPYSYIEWLETRYDDLFYSAPLIPTRIYNNFISDAKSKGYHVPEMYSATITVNKDYAHSRKCSINSSQLSEVKIEIKDESNKSDIKVGDRVDFRNHGTPSKRSFTNIILNEIKGSREESTSEEQDEEVIHRTNKMDILPDLNHYSDNMVRYQMSRMMNNEKL